MTIDLHPYPSYADTGFAWLKNIPEHWTLRRAKYLYREVDDRSTTGDEELLSVSHLTGVTLRREKNVTMFMAESNVGHKLCRPDDLVINTMWAWMAALGVATQEGLVSPSYGVYRPLSNDLMPGYADHLLRTPTYAAEYTRRSTGVNSSRLRLYPDEFLRIPIIVPPEAEQCSIVRFIGHLDRLTRGYIGAKLRLIKLLSEEKQASIQNAATRGLNSNASLKPSRMEWLGEVPEHWKEMRLKSLVHRVEQGVSPQAENYLADDGSWGVLKAGCVNRGFFKEAEHKRLPSDFVVDPNLKVEEGDVLVSRASGSPRLVGSVGRIRTLNYRLILSDKTFRLRFNSLVDPDFMTLAMNSRYYRLQVERAISGAEGLANNLPLSALRAFVFAVPPLPEQERIVFSLSGLTNRLDTAIERLEDEIRLIREYRTRLIIDVVTGQLDVREAASSLPYEDGEPDKMSLVDGILEEVDEADLGMDDTVEEVAG